MAALQSEVNAAYAEYDDEWQAHLAPVEVRGNAKGTPVFAWLLLVAAVLAVSSAAAVFQMMPEVPPLTLAASRLQLTSLILAVGAVWQWRGMATEAKSHTVHKLRWLFASGASLAVHFGGWVWSLEHTTMTHSLLFVSTTPILLVGAQLVLRHPTSIGEILGSILGLAGSIVLAFGASGSHERGVGLAGDLAALLAAAAMAGYLACGRHLRSWMPVFVYAFPVTALGATLLTATAAAMESTATLRPTHTGLFGWLASSRYAPLVVYLALVPGLVGHTGFNTLLRYLPPLTVALSTQMEPVVGPALGWALGVAPAPGPLTWAAGPVVLAATVWVTVAAGRREVGQQRKKEAAVALTAVFAGSGGWMADGTRAAGREGVVGGDDVEREGLLLARESGRA